ncbi:MAG TPA: energy transducer TonB [Vicinamibacterales bacterium]|jgi:TonB family protein
MIALRTTLVAIVLTGLTPLASTQTQEVVVPGPGVTPPRPIAQVRPDYSADAMRLGVQGQVSLECVVEVDGTPSNIRVVKSLLPSLDAEAVKALSQWRFSPGLKDGKPARVVLRIDMTFSLQSSGQAAAPAGFINVMSRMDPNGRTIVWDVARERADHQPSWQPETSAAPPLAIGDAIRAGQAWVTKIRPEVKTQALMTASLVRFGGTRWYYRVEFAPSVDNRIGDERITAIVLLDGSIVEPRTEKLP